MLTYGKLQLYVKAQDLLHQVQLLLAHNILMPIVTYARSAPIIAPFSMRHSLLSFSHTVTSYDRTFFYATSRFPFSDAQLTQAIWNLIFKLRRD